MDKNANVKNRIIGAKTGSIQQHNGSMEDITARMIGKIVTKSQMAKNIKQTKNT